MAGVSGEWEGGPGPAAFAGRGIVWQEIRMSSSALVFQDKTFRRIVVGSTGLGIAAMLASVAAVQIGKTRGLSFSWHWSVAVVMAVGVLWNWRFWNLIWQAQEGEVPNLKMKLGMHFAVLFALGLGTFLYPIRFVSAEYHVGISKGLVTAVLFLGTMGWLIFKLGRGFLKADEADAAESGE